MHGTYDVHRKDPGLMSTMDIISKRITVNVYFTNIIKYTPARYNKKKAYCTLA
jgi:hypothetical protein